MHHTSSKKLHYYTWDCGLLCAYHCPSAGQREWQQVATRIFGSSRRTKQISMWRRLYPTPIPGIIRTLDLAHAASFSMPPYSPIHPHALQPADSLEQPPPYTQHVEDELEDNIHVATLEEKKRRWWRNAFINAAFIASWSVCLVLWNLSHDSGLRLGLYQ